MNMDLIYNGQNTIFMVDIIALLKVNLRPYYGKFKTDFLLCLQQLSQLISHSARTHVLFHRLH